MNSTRMEFFRCRTGSIAAPLPPRVLSETRNGKFWLRKRRTKHGEPRDFLDIFCILYTITRHFPGRNPMKKHVEKHLTLREKILETIRDAIIAGALKPGEKVAEPELAERFGISRTPIREAFRQLESEGYLTVIPRKGAVVVSFSARDVEEFYAIKSILEGYAARRACENLTPRELEKLVAINERLRHLAAIGDIKHFFKLHGDFHDQFIRAADNEKLHELITNLLSKFQR